MKIFVTGGTGFIGRHLIKKLIERDHEVHALVRSTSGVTEVEALGARAALGDIGDPESMRAAMRGSDVVYHLAGLYSIRAGERLRSEALNVDGTRNVLELALDLGVPKIIYTSSLSVLGNTHGRLVDETHFQTGPFDSEYDRTKWLAHYEVVAPLIEKGAPIIIVMPGGVYGPGDHSWIAEAMGFFLRGYFRALPAPEFTFTYAHVEDIAEGHIQAAVKGQIGESYILAGPAIPLGEMVDFWAQLSGKRAPAFYIPASFIKPFAPIVKVVEAVVPLPQMFSSEAIRTLDYTYMGSAEKAKRELGWKTRTLHKGMGETLAWMERRYPVGTSASRGERRAARLALGAAAALFLLWLLGRRRS